MHIPHTLGRLLALGGMALLTGCGSGGTVPNANTKSVRLNEEFTLKIGEQAQVASENLHITLHSVPLESRCPNDLLALCVWEGTATVRVDMRQMAHTPASLQLHTNASAGPQRGTYRQYELQLVRLQPYPTSTQPIPPPDYVAAFILTAP